MTAKDEQRRKKEELTTEGTSLSFRIAEGSREASEIQAIEAHRVKKAEQPNSVIRFRDRSASRAKGEKLQNIARSFRDAEGKRDSADVFPIRLGFGFLIYYFYPSLYIHVFIAENGILGLFKDL